jgi:hypothetical protein
MQEEFKKLPVFDPELLKQALSGGPSLENVAVIYAETFDRRTVAFARSGATQKPAQVNTLAMSAEAPIPANGGEVVIVDESGNTVTVKP